MSLSTPKHRRISLSAIFCPDYHPSAAVLSLLILAVPWLHEMSLNDIVD